MPIRSWPRNARAQSWILRWLTTEVIQARCSAIGQTVSERESASELVPAKRGPREPDSHGSSVFVVVLRRPCESQLRPDGGTETRSSSSRGDRRRDLGNSLQHRFAGDVRRAGLHHHRLTESVTHVAGHFCYLSPRLLRSIRISSFRQPRRVRRRWRPAAEVITEGAESYLTISSANNRKDGGSTRRNDSAADVLTER
jgi:hypothetical protein